ncbi:hypothetical protein OAA14_01970 [bacterium]|nr:hypothetical protein [bacterium]MDB4327295.1 hypothetical protein [bacterium]
MYFDFRKIDVLFYLYFTINGSNDDFSLTVEVEELSRNAEKAAVVKYGQFKHLVAKNVIQLPVLADEVIAKVFSIFRGL